jgi:sugar O-acyltransferase (sialic acid O-acetyltransferase NeuD family)
MMVGPISDHVPHEGQEFICAVADPDKKRKICQSFKQRGARFVNIIHPSVIIADYSTIGEGVILCPRVIISTNVTVGDHVLINSFSVAGHDVTLEAGCTLSAQCDLMGHVYLEEEVFLGSGARIFPGMRVGRGAKIGAGSVVIRNVPAKISVFGNPARRIE